MPPTIVGKMLAGVALIAIGRALYHFYAASADVDVTPIDIGTIPAADDARRPVIVIVHGFAGSQQPMQSFATAFVRDGSHTRPPTS